VYFFFSFITSALPVDNPIPLSFLIKFFLQISFGTRFLPRFYGFSSFLVIESYFRH